MNKTGLLVIIGICGFVLSMGFAVGVANRGLCLSACTYNIDSSVTRSAP